MFICIYIFICLAFYCLALIAPASFCRELDEDQ